MFTQTILLPDLLLETDTFTNVNSQWNKIISYPTVNDAGDWLNGKPPEPEGWAEAAGVLGFAPNVNTPDGLLFVKLKFVVLLPNWKTEPIQIKEKYPINDTMLKIDFDLDILNMGKILRS